MHEQKYYVVRVKVKYPLLIKEDNLKLEAVDIYDEFMTPL